MRRGRVENAIDSSSSFERKRQGGRKTTDRQQTVDSSGMPKVVDVYLGCSKAS